MIPDPDVVLFICCMIASVLAVLGLVGVVVLDRRAARLLLRARLAEHTALRWQNVAQGQQRRHPVDPAARMARIRDELAARRDAKAAER